MQSSVPKPKRTDGRIAESAEETTRKKVTHLAKFFAASTGKGRGVTLRRDDLPQASKIFATCCWLHYTLHARTALNPRFGALPMRPVLVAKERAP